MLGNVRKTAHQPMYLCVLDWQPKTLCLCVSVSLCLCVSVSLYLCVFVSLRLWLYVSASVPVFVSVSVCVSVSVSMCLCLCLCVWFVEFLCGTFEITPQPAVSLVVS